MINVLYVGVICVGAEGARLRVRVPFTVPPQLVRPLLSPMVQSWALLKVETRVDKRLVGGYRIVWE